MRLPQLFGLRTLLDAHQPPSGPEVAFLGLGGNVGDPLKALNDAVKMLDSIDGITVDDISGVYLTEPVGPPQDDFHNIAVRVLTERSPMRLLKACHEVEQALGRVRAERWGPRTMDVDILIYGDRTISHPKLVVPHEHLTDRAFALIPLMEVAPGWRLPDGRTLSRCVADLAPIEGIDGIGQHVSLSPPPVEPAWLEEAKRRGQAMGASELGDGEPT